MYVIIGFPIWIEELFYEIKSELNQKLFAQFHLIYFVKQQ